MGYFEETGALPFSFVRLLTNPTYQPERYFGEVERTVTYTVTEHMIVRHSLIECIPVGGDLEVYVKVESMLNHHAPLWSKADYEDRLHSDPTTDRWSGQWTEQSFVKIDLS